MADILSTDIDLSTEEIALIKNITAINMMLGSNQEQSNVYL